MPFRCITICEEQFDDVEVHQFETEERMEGFKQGFCQGAGKYGCGSAQAWSIDDLAAMEPNDPNAIAIRKHLG